MRAARNAAARAWLCLAGDQPWGLHRAPPGVYAVRAGLEMRVPQDR